jgi:hypothetical protein
MRKMKVWTSEDNFTEIEVDEMDLIERIKSLKNKSFKKISEHDWFLGKIDGSQVGVNFAKGEFWTKISENRVSVSMTDEEFDFINNLLKESQNEK